MISKKEVFRLYRGQNLLTRLYVRVKLRICPFLLMENFFPEDGKIVDLGCGNGLFPAILKLGSSSREIVGIDLDQKKIEEAKKLEEIFSGLTFQTGNIVEMDYPQGDIFSLIDVLYLVPYPKQELILKKCYSALPEGGLLIIKEMDTKPLRKYFWNLFQETLAVKIIGFTLGERFYFRSRKEYLKILSDLGFEVTPVKLDSGYWYPHILYLCQK